MDESVVILGDWVQVDLVEEDAHVVVESESGLVRLAPKALVPQAIAADGHLLLFDPEEDEGGDAEDDGAHVGHDDGPSASLLQGFFRNFLTFASFVI